MSYTKVEGSRKPGRTAAPESQRHYDADTGLVQRRVFGYDAIHADEIATMFDRAWLFVGPQSWLCSPGDFVTSRMGADPVIAWCMQDGRIRVYRNCCPLGTEPLTSAARGRADVLRCPCHGLAYGADGATLRAPALDGIARVATLRGLVFANQDPQALPLAEWLGEFCWYLVLLLPPDGIGIQGDDSMRWTIAANWKLPVLSACGDQFADTTTLDHERHNAGAQIALAAGVVTVRTMEHPATDDPRRGLSALGAVVFPNLLFDLERHSLEIIHPIGPTHCEVHSYCLIPDAVPDTAIGTARRHWQFQSGPAGLETGHLSRQWQAITAGAHAARHRDQGLSLRMGLGQELPSNLPGTFAPLISEANQRAFMTWWQDQLAVPARGAKQFMRIR